MFQKRQSGLFMMYIQFNNPKSTIAKILIELCEQKQKDDFVL